MRKFVLPDEDAWGLPKDWWSGVHPRRGGRWRPVFDDPAGAGERRRACLAADKLEEHRARVLSRNVQYDEELLAAGERHLRKPDDDPAGAAVAALTTVYRNVHATAIALVDEWVARAGVPFAVRAVVEAFRMVDTGALWTPSTGGKTYDRLWRGEDLGSAHAVAMQVRRHLAIASDQDYAEAAGILARHRSYPAGRLITSYLMPTRVDWVDEDCAAAASWKTDVPPGRDDWERADHRQLVAVLLLAASRTEHLEHLRGAINHAMLGYKDVGAAVTVLDGVGPAATTYLTEKYFLEVLGLQDSFNRRDRLGPDATRIAAGTPADDALRMLLRDKLDNKPTRPGSLLKSGALTRYPIRALRLLAERDDAVSADLFGAIVLGEPRLIPHLPDVVRHRAEQIVTSAGAGLGAGWAAMLDGNDYRKPIESADDVKRAVEALAAIPAEDAFGLLVDRAERKYFRPALLTAAKRDPGLAVRVLAAKASDPAVAELLRDHVLAYPQSLSALDEAGRARVQAITGPPTTGDGCVPPALGGTPPRLPSLPEWLIPAKLPEVTVHDAGEVLAPEAVQRLCVLLSLSTIAEPRPEITEVRRICEAQQLSAFARAIFEQWRAAQFPPKSNLAMVALALLGDDTTVPALAANFPGWSSTSARVRSGMDVLAAIGTDPALTHLNWLSRRATTAGFRRHATQRLAEVATARGLSPDQLADRIVPDLGLDADGRMTLDYGPRRFTVGLDEQLRPWVAAEDGRRLSRLPRPAATDDPALAPAAYQLFAELKKEAKQVGGDRIRAVEDAMVTGRTWSAAEFRELFLEHPLMWQLAHRLLWVSFGEHGPAVFRIAEDRTLADLDDKTWELDDTATVGVPHPWHFAADRDAWSEVFTDYAIIQPFPQVGRELTTPGEVNLASFTGARVDGRKVFVLTSRGWRFGDDHASVLRDWPQTVEIVYTPGYHWQESDQSKTLTAVHGLDGLDPIPYSEVVRDLHYLTS